MIVDKIRLVEHAEHCQLTARVRRESGPAWENDLWFRFPSRLRPGLIAEADPFLTALLLPSMVGEKRLLIEGSVAPKLLKNAARIQDIYTAWVGNARHVSIETGQRPMLVEPPGPGTGVFFSGGVDSFYTLLKNAGTVTHLILIDRLDSKQMNSEAVCRDTREHAGRVAARLGKELLVVETNARTLFVPAVTWRYYHGAVLAAIGLALRKVMGTVFIAGTHTYDHLRPWGSHPLLDPLWSTEATEIVYDGAEATRAQKVMNCLCHSELALQSLRVCLSADDQYNCGRCEKCLRTMIPLYVAGYLGRSTAFPSTLAVEEVAQHAYATHGKIQFIEENITLLRGKADKSPLDHQLIRALEDAVTRSRKKLVRRERKSSRKLRPSQGLLTDMFRKLTNT